MLTKCAMFDSHLDLTYGIMLMEYLVLSFGLLLVQFHNQEQCVWCMQGSRHCEFNVEIPQSISICVMLISELFGAGKHLSINMRVPCWL